MRLGVRFVLYLGVASLVPLGLLGAGATRLGGDRVLDKVAELQGANAQAVATLVETWVGLQLRMLGQQSTAVALDALGPEARGQWRRLVYLQSPELGLVAELDAGGTLVGPPARLTDPAQQSGALARRPVVDDARLDAFLDALPLARMQTARARARPGTVPAPAVGRPLRPAGAAAPVLPVLLALPESGGLAVELSLGTLAQELALRASDSRAVVIVDANGDAIVGDPRDWVEPGPLGPLLRGVAATSIRYQTADGVEILAACAPVRGLGWTVIVAEPVAASMAAVRDIRLQTAYIALVTAILSVVVGGLFARQLSRPIVALKTAALAVADGDYGRRLPARGTDEVTELARAFNFMSARLEDNAARIADQSAEIAAFNAELQARVDARTRELSEAQAQLVRSAELAAVGEMGAGLAHELNNPVAGILGLSQLLSRRPLGAGELRMVQSIEEQARRCKDIVASLLGFSRDDLPAERAARTRVAVATLVDEVLALVRSGLQSRRIQVAVEVDPGLACGGDPAVLGRALAQLLMSVRAAAPDGGELRILGETDAGAPGLRLALQAPRTAVGSDDWMASGMGLWAARQAIVAQGGALDVPGADRHDPGAAGALVWRVRLPEVMDSP